jgi:hypothetical protein
VFGADAYGLIDINGSGSVEMIFKPQGSSGTERSAQSARNHRGQSHGVRGESP